MPGNPALADLIKVCACCAAMQWKCFVEMPNAWVREVLKYVPPSGEGAATGPATADPARA